MFTEKIVLKPWPGQPTKEVTASDRTQPNFEAYIKEGFFHQCTITDQEWVKIRAKKINLFSGNSFLFVIWSNLIFSFMRRKPEIECCRSWFHFRGLDSRSKEESGTNGLTAAEAAFVLIRALAQGTLTFKKGGSISSADLLVLTI